MHVLLLSVLMIAGLFAGDAGDEFDRLRERTVAIYTGGSAWRSDDPVLGPRLAELVRRVVSDGRTRRADGSGCWDTLETGPKRSNRLWRDVGRLTASYTNVVDSVARLHEMARVYAMPGSPLHRDPALGWDIAEAVDFLCAQNYNERIEHTGYADWFALELGVPLRLLPTLMMAYDAIPAEVRQRALRAVDRFSPNPDTIGGHHQPATGANLAWKARVVAMSAILGRDARRLEAVVPAMAPLWATAEAGDGFHADGSFIQHRCFAYNGGYGIAAVAEPLLTMQLLAGSRWAMPPDRIAVLVARLDGSFAPFMADGGMMDMVRGREISRATSTSRDAGMGVVRMYVRALDLVPEAERPRLESIIRTWTVGGSLPPLPDRPSTLAEDAAIVALSHVPGTPAQPAAQGFRVFPAMDRVAQRAGAWSAGLAMHSSRIAAYEAINGENRRGWHTGSGHLALYLGDPGHFADGYWPTVDAHRLAGVTAPAGSEPGGERSGSPRVGGVALADGSSGLAVMDLADGKLACTGRKAWVFFDGAIACLGAGLTGSDLETTLENRRILGDAGRRLAVVPAQPVPVLTDAPAAPLRLEGVRQLHVSGDGADAGLGIVFPEPVEVHAVRERRTGSWSDISTTSLLPVPRERMTRSYLTMWIRHGAETRDASYTYVLLPGADAARTATWAAQPRVRVLTNTPTVQAVAAPGLGLTAIAVWDGAGRAGGKGSPAVSLDGPALAIVRLVDGRLQVAVSDPTQLRSDSVVVEVQAAMTRLVAADPAVAVESIAEPLRLRISLAGLRGRTAHAELR